MTKLYIGTAGWSYKDWVPSFYPKTQTGKFNWLQFYAAYFNLVEVNASYYTYLNPSIVSSWLYKVSDNSDFNFTIKLHQDFTHKMNYSQQNIKDTITNLGILHKEGRLGGLLLQFPYSFAFSDANLDYIRTLINIFNSFECFVEVRHKSWNNEKVMDYFRSEQIVFCTIDQPQIGRSISFNPVVTGTSAYIRFHGRNYGSWFKSLNVNSTVKQTYAEQSARYDYLYSPGELIEISRRIKEIYDKVNNIYIIMNNHPFGNAPANAFELLSMLAGNKKVSIPQNCLEAFPRLKEIAA
jgi:uncharacterized protein YecE (DUF72 family)